MLYVMDILSARIIPFAQGKPCSKLILAQQQSHVMGLLAGAITV